MKNDNQHNDPEYRAMAEAAIAVLDTRFLKALTDPTRVSIIKRLILLGACDISTVKHGLSQDRSVISRHLKTLEEAGIVKSHKSGRHMMYDIDGPYVVQKVELILDSLQPMAELCIPFEKMKTGAAA